jgi:hypothetical protein
MEGKCSWRGSGDSLTGHWRKPVASLTLSTSGVDCCGSTSFYNTLQHHPPSGLTQWTEYRMKNAVFWDVAPCRSCEMNRRFGGSYRLYLQGRNPRARNQREQVAATCSRWFLARILHSHRCENLKSYIEYRMLNWIMYVRNKDLGDTRRRYGWINEAGTG